MKFDTFSFLERARKIHGNYYDYSKTKYTGVKNRVKIICPKHGDFFQRPDDHLRGKGCKKCSFEKRRKFPPEKVLEKMRKIHEGYYDYSLSSFTNLSSRIKIICPKHGIFVSTVRNHLAGKKCRKCSHEILRKKAFEQFVESAKKIHGKKYSYVYSENFSRKKNLEILCPKHGKFRISKKFHLAGKGCPKCVKFPHDTIENFEDFVSLANSLHGNSYTYEYFENFSPNFRIRIFCKKHGYFSSTVKNHLYDLERCPFCKRHTRKNTKFFVEEAKLIHGNYYDYSLVEYVNNRTPVKIRCRKHGIFFKKPYNHLAGEGCPKCTRRKTRVSFRRNKELFVNEAKEIHGNYYDYSLVNYKNNKIPVEIICPEHGIFLQQPIHHLRGRKCPSCSWSSFTRTTEKFILEAKKVHGNLYDYSETEYINANSKVKIKCRIHGDFFQLASNHLRGRGCPKCKKTISSDENSLFFFVKNFYPDAISSNRQILEGKEIDIYIPSRKIAIEYCGLYWHTDNRIPPLYHFEKTSKCEKKGIFLVTVFSSDSTNKIYRYLISLFGKREKGTGARNLKIRKISKNEAIRFYEKHSLFEEIPFFSLAYGCFFENELVAIMLLNSKKIRNLEAWKLVHFSTGGRNYPGAISRMWKTFLRERNPEFVFSFCDSRLFRGKTYEILGFEIRRKISPTFVYTNGKKISRFHREKFTRRVWNCGKILWIYSRNKDKKELVPTEGIEPPT